MRNAPTFRGASTLTKSAWALDPCLNHCRCFQLKTKRQNPCQSCMEVSLSSPMKYNGGGEPHHYLRGDKHHLK